MSIAHAMQILVSLVLTLVIVPAANADFMTGSKLYALLTSGNTSDRLTGRGYIMGAADSIRGSVELMAPDAKASFSHCTPDGADLTQFELVVKKYMADHPNELHYGAAVIIAVALSAAFPCKA